MPLEPQSKEEKIIESYLEDLMLFGTAAVLITDEDIKRIPPSELYLCH